MQPLHVRAGRRDRCVDARPDRRQRRGQQDAHGAGLPNNVASDSARYPLPAAPAADERSPDGASAARRRRWWASTSVMTSLGAGVRYSWVVERWA